MNVLPESNPKPEVQNPKPEMMGYEKPDPTRNPRKVYPLMPYYVTYKPALDNHLLSQTARIVCFHKCQLRPTMVHQWADQ